MVSILNHIISLFDLISIVSINLKYMYVYIFLRLQLHPARTTSHRFIAYHLEVKILINKPDTAPTPEAFAALVVTPELILL